MIDFLSFLKEYVKTFSTQDHNNWYIHVLADYLEAVYQRKINRLIINIPPRMMKSIVTSVAWVAWMLGKDPSTQIIVASYTMSLSLKHSIDCRYLIHSDMYKNYFPNLDILRDQNTKSKFQTTENGFRLATSVGGYMTGEGADILIADDLMSPVQANSTKLRAYTIQWFKEVFLTRLNNFRTGAVVVIMHRLHQEDLCGQLLLSEGSWHHLSIPMVADDEINFYSYLYDNKILYTMQPGEIINSLKYHSRDIDNIRRTIGEYVFSAQYQQSPFNYKVGIINQESIMYYDTLDTNDGIIIHSWDTANTASGDYSVCIKFYYYNNHHYILDVIRKQLNYPMLRKLVRDTIVNDKPNTVLIENKSSGISLIQELQEIFPIISITPHKDKISRFMGVVPILENGKIWLPRNKYWRVPFEQELLEFPHSRYDDQVDALTQYLSWFTKKFNNLYNIRCL
ncbi:MAG: hypothetical protein P857_1028 [Candidatus Xenolissoclinum pacificiensis L6]|uniref:Terminase large subunit gp17-like C-terminal domain-containing protein n=1 Tax=Candidatus Xenolissoclinum pacificiensis L6 TaxID=1401685 RepID=W2V172_9RICK|nr:MAG: hypothetical protein P857_1028 [Candidatus Xenolissoclinum pacificiensis L6]